MIVRTFIPGEPVTDATQDATQATNLIRLLRRIGVRFLTADMATPDGGMVILFWSVTPTGQVVTLWEHTMCVVDGTHATGVVAELADTSK